MRFESLHLDGYGLFYNADLKEIAPGLNVIEGPNEAGKSTLLEFVRFLLVGGRPGTYILPLRGGKFGGWASLRDQEGHVWRLERRKGPHDGPLSISPPLAVEDRLLGGVSRGLYTNIFAFGLSELLNLKDVDKEAPGTLLYGAATGSGTRSLLDAMDGLSKSVDVLYATALRKGSTKEIHKLVEQWRDLQNQISKLGENLTQYNGKVEECARLEENIGALEAQAAKAKHDLFVANSQRSAWESWVSLLESRTRLAQLPEIDEFPLDALERLATLDVVCKEAEKRCKQLEQECKDAEEILQGHVVNELLLGLGDRIEKLADGRQRLGALREDHPSKLSALKVLRDQALDALQELGPQWTRENLTQFDTSISVSQQMDQFREILRAAAQEKEIIGPRLYDAKDLQGKSEKDYKAALLALKVAYPEEPVPLEDANDRILALRETDSLLVKLEERFADANGQRLEKQQALALAQRNAQESAEEFARKIKAAQAKVEKAVEEKELRFSAEPAAVLDGDARLNDLEAAAFQFSELKNYAVAVEAIKGKQEDIAEQGRKKLKEWTAWSENLQAKARGEAAVATERLGEAFPDGAPGHAVSEDDQTDLDRADDICREKARLSYQSLEPRPTMQSQAAPSGSGMLWPGIAFAIAFIAGAVFAGMQGQPLLAAGLGVIGVLIGIVAVVLSKMSGPRSASSPQAPVNNERLAELNGLLQQINEKHGWNLTDEATVKEQERKLRDHNQSWQRYLALDSEVRRCGVAYEVALAEIATSKEALQKEDEERGELLTGLENKLKETQSQQSAGRTAAVQLCEKWGYQCDDAKSALETRRDLDTDIRRRREYEQLEQVVISHRALCSELASESEERSEAAKQRIQQYTRELEEAREKLSDENTPERLRLNSLGELYQWEPTSRDVVRELKDSLALWQQEVEKYRARVESVQSLEKKWDEAKEKFLELEKQSKEFDQKAQESRAEWEAWLANHQLPPAFSPDIALSHVERARKCREDFKSIDVLEKEFEERTAELTEQEKEVASLCATLKLPVPAPGELEGWIKTTRISLGQQNDLVTQREAATTDLLKSGESLKFAHEELQEGREELRLLLTEGAAADAEEFRRRAEIFSQRRQLQDKISGLEATLNALSAPGAPRLALEKSLELLDFTSLEDRVAGAQQSFDDLEREVDQLRDILGGARAELKALEGAEVMLKNRQDLAAVEARMEEAGNRWAVLKTVHWMMEKTRHDFEKERQPEIIKLSGAILKEMTGGRYEEIRTQGKLEDMELVTANDAHKSSSQWSRGTREQLYLALRFAMIDAYCRSKEPLPVIMDDVLVNADGFGRFEAAAKEVAKLAQRHQVLYFTCRPEDANVLCAAAKGARHYRLQDGAFTAV